MKIDENKAILLVYTRIQTDRLYNKALTNSVHMAYSNDGVEFKPLNQNYGMLYPSATISSRNTINAKGLKSPYLFRTADNSYGIVAVRTNAEGDDDEESKGKILLWISKDLIHFKECGLLKLKEDTYIQGVMCEYNVSEKVYEIKWYDSRWNYYKNTLPDLNNISEISAPETDNPYTVEKMPTNLIDIIQGNCLAVSKEFGNSLLTRWSPLENIDIKVPDSIEAASVEEIKSVKATAIYNDGSTALKKVIWDTSNIDFSSPDLYTIRGKVTQEFYSFPLAVGYADPDILEWNGKYYFIATNDNTNNIGLYVREADTISGLFEKGFKEHLILDRDEERNLIQTFWAPEFHVIENELYILFAVSGKQWGPQSHMMKLKKDGCIINAEDWENPIRVKRKDGSFLAEDGITLDMTYMNVDGTSYLLWSYRKGIGTPDDTGSMIYIATIDSRMPWVLTSETVLLSRPLFGWENISGTINNEGPYPLITDDYVHIAFSGGAAGGYTYVLGLLSAKRGSNLMNLTEWEKFCAPVMSYYSVEGEYGPGHNTFYTDKEGNVLNTYHVQERPFRSPRCTAVRRVHFNKDGFPVFSMSAERDLKENLTNVSMKVIVPKL